MMSLADRVHNSVLIGVRDREDSQVAYLPSVGMDMTDMQMFKYNASFGLKGWYRDPVARYASTIEEFLQEGVQDLD